MGWHQHHTIVVTGFDPDNLQKAKNQAIEIFKKTGHEHLVSEIIHAMNGYSSFFIAPDGSKEGWEDSNQCNKARAEFIDFMNSDSIEYTEYVEACFSSELDDHDEVTNSSKQFRTSKI